MNKLKSTMLGVLVSGIFMLSGCTVSEPQIDHDSPIDTPVTNDPVNVDLSKYNDQDQRCPKVTANKVHQCSTQDGILRRDGMLGCYSCVVTYKDAGKRCKDASDCEGTCRAIDIGEFLPAGTPNQKGECAKNSSPFGCYQIIENGVLQPALCVD